MTIAAHGDLDAVQVLAQSDFGQFANDWARILYNRAMVYLELADRSQCLKDIQKSVELREALNEIKPGRHMRDLGLSLHRYAYELMEIKDFSTALRVIDKCIQCREQLMRVSPSTDGHDLLGSYLFKLTLLQKQGMPTEVLLDWNIKRIQALKYLINKSSVFESDGGVNEYCKLLLDLMVLGEQFFNEGQFQLAINCLKVGFDGEQILLRWKEKLNLQNKIFLLNNLADGITLLFEMGAQMPLDLDKAEQWCLEAIKMYLPSDIYSEVQVAFQEDCLGFIRCLKAEQEQSVQLFEDAISTLTNAVDIWNKYSNEKNDLLALRAKGRIERCRKGIHDIEQLK